MDGVHFICFRPSPTKKHNLCLFILKKQALGFHGNDRFRYHVVTVTQKQRNRKIVRIICAMQSGTDLRGLLSIQSHFDTNGS